MVSTIYVISEISVQNVKEKVPEIADQFSQFYVDNINISHNITYCSVRTVCSQLPPMSLSTLHVRIP